jgi:hypothetical protein
MLQSKRKEKEKVLHMTGKKLLSYWGGIVVLLIFWGYSSPGVYAQLAVTTATVSGTVTDPSGSVVSEATVTLTSSERGVSRTFTTGALGTYSFSQLPPSTYQLVIRAKGFEEYVQNGITLDAGQSASQDITLTLGSVVQQVVVTSEAPLINTTNANLSAEVDSKQIVELPLNLRNIYGLMTLNWRVPSSLAHSVSILLDLEVG